VTSTTGAYGDFPDDYYEKGNQFSIYLSGDAPQKSWDDRHEQAVDGGHAILSVQRSPKQPSLSERLTEVVQVALTAEGALRVLTQLEEAHRIDVEPASAKDAKEELVSLLLNRLTQAQQRLVLERLEAGAVAAYSAEQEKQRRAAGPPRRRRQPNRQERTPKTTASKSASGQTCAICRSRVTKAQAKACLADPLLMGHVYCIDHGTKSRRTLGR
jgi:hypothetical protein